MRNIFFVLGCVGALLVGSSVYAATSWETTLDTDQRSLYTDVAAIPALSIRVPRVVEYRIPATQFREMAVYDQTISRIEQAMLFTRHTRAIQVSQLVDGKSISARDLVDERSETTMDFPLKEKTAKGTVRLRIDADKMFASGRFSYSMSPNVTPPDTISVDVFDEQGVRTPVVYRGQVNGSSLSFPLHYARHWEVELEYHQPLRLSEVGFDGDDTTGETYEVVRFLAQPGHAYQLYGARTLTSRYVPSQGTNLTDDRDVQQFAEPLVFSVNPSYQEPDTDQDGIRDSIDNCALVANREQADIDLNGTGDACDDFDRDGYINTKDNCPDLPNYDQRDADGDLVGDTCDDYDNRFTERNAWVPWVGIGAAATVLIVLFFLMLKRKPLEEEAHEMDTPISEQGSE